MKSENAALDAILTGRKGQVLGGWMAEVGQGGDSAEAEKLLSALHEAIRADAGAAQIDGAVLDRVRDALALI